MALVVILSTAVPLGLGFWIDRRFDTAPLFVFIGALAGIIAGTVGIVRIAVRTIDAVARLPKVEGGVEKAASGKED